MKLTDFFRSGRLDRSRKRKALQKVLAKLQTTQSWLEKEIASNRSGTKRRHLEIRLKTNRKQSEKTRKLIAELDRGDTAKRPRPGLTGTRLLSS